MAEYTKWQITQWQVVQCNGRLLSDMLYSKMTRLLHKGRSDCLNTLAYYTIKLSRIINKYCNWRIRSIKSKICITMRNSRKNSFFITSELSRKWKPIKRGEKLPIISSKRKVINHPYKWAQCWRMVLKQQMENLLGHFFRHFHLGPFNSQDLSTQIVARREDGDFGCCSCDDCVTNLCQVSYLLPSAKTR